MSKVQEPRGDDNIVDTDNDTEHGLIHDTKEVENINKNNITTVISENRQDKEINDEKYILMLQLKHRQNWKTVILLMHRKEVLTNLWRDMTKPSVGTVYTEKDTHFEDLRITGDYSDYDVLEEELETISLNDIVWVKVKNSIWKGRVIQIPYSIKEEESEQLKIK